MPIPTRTSPVKSYLEPSLTARSVSQGNAITSKGGIERDGRGQIPGSSTTSTTIKSTTAQSRTLPKVAAKDTSSTRQHGRTPSTNITSNRLAPVRVATESSSRTSSASSSSVSHSTGTTKLTANTRRGVATTTKATENARSVSTGTTRTAIGKSISSQPTRLKSTSTLQPRPQPSRTAKDQPSTAASTKTRQPSSTTKVEPTAKLQQLANRNTSTSSSPSTATLTASAQNTSRIYDEVYQLQLTHAQSSTILNQYKQSIETTIQKRRTYLQAQQTDLLVLESQIQEAKSTDALHKWLYPCQASKQTRPNHTTTASIDQNTATQRIHNLNTQISTLDALHTSDALAPLTQFESWLETALSIHKNRVYRTNTNVNKQSQRSSDLELIASLGYPWTAQMRSLQDRLHGVVAGLHDLRFPSPPSTTAIKLEGLGLGLKDQTEDEDEDTGISTILLRYTRLAETLLREVEVAVAVERAVMAAEAQWEEQKVREALTDLGLTDGSGGAVRKGPGAGDGDAGKTYPGIWAV